MAANGKPRPPHTGLARKKGERLLDSRKDAVVEALRKAKGIRSLAAQILGVDRGTLAQFMDLNPDIISAAAEIDESNGDYVEAKLFKAIEAKDVRAITFYLATKMKHRGYTTRTEQTGPNGGPIVHYVEPSADDMLAALERIAAKRARRDASEIKAIGQNGNGRAN